MNKVAFTGSTEVGQLIMAGCATSNLKRVSLELGGKSPLVIFSDAPDREFFLETHETQYFLYGSNCTLTLQKSEFAKEKGSVDMCTARME